MEEFRKSERGQVLIRGALMLVFGLLLNLVITLVGVLAFIQFLWMLVTTDRNQFIADISSDLSRWMSVTSPARKRFGRSKIINCSKKAQRLGLNYDVSSL